VACAFYHQLLFEGSKVRRQGHSHETKSQEDDARNRQCATHLRRVEHQGSALGEAVKAKPSGKSKQEVEQRTERVGMKGESQVAMKQGRPTRRQAAARAGTIEEQHAWAWWQTELLVGSMSGRIGF
jgi:hypothetical protein